MAESEVQRFEVVYRGEAFGHEGVLRFELPLRVVDGRIEVVEREPHYSWEVTPAENSGIATRGAFVCVRLPTESQATLAWVRETIAAFEASTREE